MKAKFISVGLSYSVGKVKIPNSGYETDDPQIIEMLRKSQGYGNFFHEVPSSEAVHEMEVEHAKRLLGKEGLLPPNAVEPLSVPNIEEEEEALRADEAAKAQDEAEAAEIKAQKAARRAQLDAKRELNRNK